MRTKSNKKRLAWGAALAALVLASSQASAADFSALGRGEAPDAPAPQTGTLAYAPGADWAERLSDPEMAELRGGFFGIGFSFYGTLSNTDAVTGTVTMNTDSLVAPPKVSPGGEVSFGTALGTNSFNGFNGVLQHLSVVGNGNVVGQNLYMNVILVRDSNPNSVSSLMSALGPRL